MQGNYDYYSLYLVAPWRMVTIGLMTTYGMEADRYPVTVFNIVGEVIGTAGNKAEYISIWNGDNTNTGLGILEGGYGPFSFTLRLRPGQPIPESLKGDPVVVFNGVFGNEFAFEFN